MQNTAKKRSKEKFSFLKESWLRSHDFQRISFSLDLAVDGLDDSRTVTSATTPDAVRQTPRQHAKFSTATWPQMN